MHLELFRKTIMIPNLLAHIGLDANNKGRTKWGQEPSDNPFAPGHLVKASNLCFHSSIGGAHLIRKTGQIRPLICRSSCVAFRAGKHGSALSALKSRRAGRLCLSGA